MIKVFPDIEELNRFAAEKFVEIANSAIKKHTVFDVALAGGSTPKSLYKLLASENFKDKVDWTKVFFYFGDERIVPPDDEESNFRMANENLFKRLKLPDKKGFRWYDTNINRWFTEDKDAEKIAKHYAEQIFIAFALDEEERFPRFDLILLGMGADGHTASLFPYTEALHETDKLAIANWVEKLQTDRLTLTFPVINNAANVMFLVSGAEKAEALREVLQGENNPDKFPAQKVQLNDGNLFWLVDREAARLLQ